MSEDDRERRATYIPEEGGVRGSDTMVILSGAPHPIAAHLFINFNLDAQVSAANTNYIGYMGPNAAAKEFIDPAILADPTVNPDHGARSTSSRSCSTSGVDEDKYTERWNALKADRGREPAPRPSRALASAVDASAPMPAAALSRSPRGAGPGRCPGVAWLAALLHRPARRSSSSSAWDAATATGQRRARPARRSTTTPRRRDPEFLPDLRQLAPLRRDHDDPVDRDRLPDRLLDLAATAAAARSCC